MALYVVRHGRTEANASGKLLGRTDVELDPVGREQARLLGEALPTGAHIVTSPLTRCRETAELISTTSGRSADVVQADDRLMELDYGELDLTPLSEVSPDVWSAWRADADFRPPGGETLNELQRRVNGCLDDVRQQALETDVVVVTHVSPIKAAVAWALGVDITISWRCFVAQASITRIGFGPAGSSLQLFNAVDHLDT